MTEQVPVAVLVADDDADIRELVAFKLEQAGFDVTAVADGAARSTPSAPIPLGSPCST